MPYASHKNTDIRTGRHCVFNMHVHLVFITKYRRKVFTNQHIESLKTIFAKVCVDYEAELVECDGEEDHVHLLIQYPPKIAISRLVNSLKTVSSRKIRHAYPDIETRYYKNVLWTPSYFAASCGGAPLDSIRHYVKSQRVVNPNDSPYIPAQ